MKLKLSTIVAVLFATATWAQVTPEQAAQLKTDAEMTYFSIESVRSAYNDFCKSSSYDAKLYGEKLQESL